MPGPHYNAPLMSYPVEIRRAMRIIILGQCVGSIGPLLFSNGVMLAYVLRLGIPAYQVLFLFALMPLINMALTLPFAFWADHTGKRKLGGAGLVVSIIGFLLLPLAASLPGTTGWLVAGILLFSVGNTANGASWFALLSPIVPKEIRGRWFGQLRMAWQTTAIVFSLGVAALLQHFTKVGVYQLVLIASGALMIVRMFLYLQIPELDPVCPPRDGLFKSLRSLFHVPGYLRFCIYIFLLTFVFAGSGLLGLLNKEVLGFSDSQLVVMGNLSAIGSIAGFYAGGKAVDRFGAKPVFLTGTLLFALTLAGVLLRGFSPWTAQTTLGVLSLFCGAILGATGIASTSELLALIPQENKSISTGFNLALIAAGLSLAGFLNGQLLKMQVLPAEWMLLGHPMSEYDVLLAGFAGLALLMATAPGLVPTIRHLHSQWIPQNR